MLTIDILTTTLSDQIRFRRGFQLSLDTVKGVLFVDSSFPQSADPSFLYIFDSANIDYSMLYAHQELCYLCSVSDSCSLEASALEIFDNIVLIESPISQLFNAVTLSLITYRNWLKKLNSCNDLQGITELANSMFHFPLAVLNSFFFTDSIALCSPPKSSIFASLHSGQRLSSTLAKSILDSEREHFNQSCLTIIDTGIELVDYPIRFNKRVIARVLIEFDSELDTPTARAYIDDFVSCIKPFLENTDSLKKLSMSAVSSLITDIIDQNITNPAEIEACRKQLPDMVHGKTYHPIVIKFNHPDNSIPYNYISGQLERIFPGCSVATYNNGLVVIAPKEHYYSPFSFDRDYFMELLERFDAFAGIGNGTLYLNALRPLYIEAAATARLGRIFCPDKTERIFYYRDYSMYFFVDMCIESAVLNHSIKSLSYLCDPGVIGLLRYDKKHGAELFKTLCSYIDCNSNAALCAQKLFAHRNTIQKRLKQIESIIGNSLSDAQVVQRLSFSAKIIEYEIKYLSLNPTDTSSDESAVEKWSSYRSIISKPV